MRKKSDAVNIEGLAPIVRDALPKIEAALRRFLEPYKELVVTSARDQHEHHPWSLHNQGLAVDIRTRFLSREGQAHLAHIIRDMLGDEEWDVVPETSPQHIHIEYDPK